MPSWPAYSHADILELAEYSSVPVINGLSDTEHPCQALADVMTNIERKGDLRGVNVAFVGDAKNVAISLAYAVTMLGGHLSVASPQGYQLPAHVAARAAPSELPEKEASGVWYRTGCFRRWNRAALLGASPGASTAVTMMLELIQKCFKKQSQAEAWQARLHEMAPSFGQSISKSEKLVAESWKRTNKVLKLV